MIAVVDYGVGNLYSLTGSLKYLGLPCAVTSDGTEIARADRIVLPGVGAFADAYQKLNNTGLIPVLQQCAQEGKPMLGICLGMQMLFDRSFEYGEHNGLGFVHGDVCPIAQDLTRPLKVPHMGWNALHLHGNSPLLRYVDEGEYVYFVHSYYAKHCDEATIATADYDVTITAAVQVGNVFGTQFHPEKSGETGLRILKAFSEI